MITPRRGKKEKVARSLALNLLVLVSQSFLSIAEVKENQVKGCETLGLCGGMGRVEKK